jgi:hypothetical protein
LTACDRETSETIRLSGSGDLVTRQEEIAGFERIDASHGFQLNISQGDTFGVTLIVDDNVLDYLRAEKRGTTLELGLDPDHSYNLSGVTLQAEIKMPVLVGLQTSGGSHTVLTRFNVENRFEAEISGGGSLRGEIDADRMDLELSGGSGVSLQGESRDLKLRCSGGGEVDLSGLVVRDADLHLSGGSRARVWVTGQLVTEASGGSAIYYGGEPASVQIKSSGGSTVEREN